MEIVLKYIGDGAYIPGVPRCDLTQYLIDDTGMTADKLCEYAPAVYERVTTASTEPVAATHDGVK